MKLTFSFRKKKNKFQFAIYASRTWYSHCLAQWFGIKHIWDANTETCKEAKKEEKNQQIERVWKNEITAKVFTLALNETSVYTLQTLIQKSYHYCRVFMYLVTHLLCLQQWISVGIAPFCAFNCCLKLMLLLLLLLFPHISPADLWAHLIHFEWET